MPACLPVFLSARLPCIDDDYLLILLLPTTSFCISQVLRDFSLVGPREVKSQDTDLPLLEITFSPSDNASLQATRRV